jgi:hypothetical protein
MRVMSKGKVWRRKVEWRTLCERFAKSGLGQQRTRHSSVGPHLTAVKVIVRNHSLFVCDTLSRGGRRRSDSLELAYGAQALCASWVAP